MINRKKKITIRFAKSKDENDLELLRNQKRLVSTCISLQKARQDVVMSA